DVPWFSRVWEALRLRRDRRAELGHVGPAEGDEAGLPELRGQVRGHRPPDVTQRADAERGRLARHQAPDVLEEDRHAAERPVRQLVGGLGARLVVAGPDDGVEGRVHRLYRGDTRPP